MEISDYRNERQVQPRDYLQALQDLFVSQQIKLSSALVQGDLGWHEHGIEQALSPLPR